MPTGNSIRIGDIRNYVSVNPPIDDRRLATIAENADMDFRISDEDMAVLDAMDERG